MKYLCILMFLSATCFAEEVSFYLKKERSMNLLVEKKSEESVVIETESPASPKILRVEKKDGFKLIYLDAGSSGTYRQLKHEKVAIFDMKKKIFHEKIYLTKIEGYEKKDQPSFKFSNGKVIYHLPK